MANILEQLRKTAFWTLDSAKGGPVKKHYTAVKTIAESNDEVLKQNDSAKKTEGLISHAVATVPFYKQYAGKALQDLPVVNKNLIRENESSFYSDKYNEAERIKVVTSGSTGTPFKVYHDPNKRLRNSADTLYFAEKAGFKPGNRLFYLKIWSGNNAKNPIQGFMQNVVPVDVIHFDDVQIKDMLSQIKSNGASNGILGYASALELIARYMDKNNYPVMKGRVNSVISMSESLSDYTKETLSKYFNVGVVSRYSNLENGIIAQQETDGSPEFTINTASYVVEILDFHTDNPVEDGEMGRIVVTDLFNYAMPMLRYDTGDVGAFVAEDHSRFRKIEGRKLDQIFDTRGKLVSSYIVYKNMWQYTEIKQYQLVQYGEKDYVFKVNHDGTFNRDAQLISEFKSYLGDDANFTIEYVDDIPLLSSGKRKKIMNTYHNKP